jgi:hypothetical protein
LRRRERSSAPGWFGFGRHARRARGDGSCVAGFPLTNRPALDVTRAATGRDYRRRFGAFSAERFKTAHRRRSSHRTECRSRADRAEGNGVIRAASFAGRSVESDAPCEHHSVTRDALPVHRVYVDGFFSDATEVTNEDSRSSSRRRSTSPLQSGRQRPKRFLDAKISWRARGLTPTATKVSPTITSGGATRKGELASSRGPFEQDHRQGESPSRSARLRRRRSLCEVDGSVYPRAEWEFAARGLAGKPIRGATIFRRADSRANTYQGVR